MERFILVLCGWLLPLFALADVAPEIALRLAEGEYLPGDVLEFEAEMCGPDYAEFELHMPANAQLHFVAYTREPVRYTDGAYQQRILLQLQPMSAGDFKLDGITASVAQGGVAADVALPPVLFSVASYAAEDTSLAVAELSEEAAVQAQTSGIKRILIWVFFVVLTVLWLRLKVANSKPERTVSTAVGLSDLRIAVEAGEDTTELINQLLERSALSLSPTLREHLEAAVYANRLDPVVLLQLLRQEVQR